MTVFRRRIEDASCRLLLPVLTSVRIVTELSPAPLAHDFQTTNVRLVCLQRTFREAGEGQNLGL